MWWEAGGQLQAKEVRTNGKGPTSVSCAPGSEDPGLGIGSFSEALPVETGGVPRKTYL